MLQVSELKPYDLLVFKPTGAILYVEQINTAVGQPTVVLAYRDFYNYLCRILLPEPALLDYRRFSPEDDNPSLFVAGVGVASPLFKWLDTATPRVKATLELEHNSELVKFHEPIGSFGVEPETPINEHCTGCIYRLDGKFYALSLRRAEGWWLFEVGKRYSDTKPLLIKDLDQLPNPFIHASELGFGKLVSKVHRVCYPFVPNPTISGHEPLLVLHDGETCESTSLVGFLDLLTQS